MREIIIFVVILAALIPVIYDIRNPRPRRKFTFAEKYWIDFNKKLRWWFFNQ